MKKKLLTAIHLFFCLAIFVLYPETVNAVSTAKAKEAVDITKSCTLALTYSAEGISCANQEIRVYKAAELSSDFTYTLWGDFSEYAVDLKDIASGGRWEETAATLHAYVIADHIAPDWKQNTDDEGTVHFTDLSCGLYLVSAVRITAADRCYTFAPFLIAVPGVQEDGAWCYDVSVKPKFTMEQYTHDDLVYKVVKTWRDTGYREKRPEHIQIDLYQNGEYVETQRLSSDNNWSYSWKTVDDGSTWTVAERNVPKGYTVAVSRTGNTFSVENSYLDTVIPPHTGDDTNYLTYVFLLCGSGVLLMLLGIIGRKTRHE